MCYRENIFILILIILFSLMFFACQSDYTQEMKEQEIYINKDTSKIKRIKIKTH